MWTIVEREAEGLRGLEPCMHKGGAVWHIKLNIEPTHSILVGPAEKYQKMLLEASEHPERDYLNT